MLYPNDDSHDPTTPRGLSARRADILALISQGLTNTEIAGELGLSTHTVKTHIRAIYHQTGAGSRSQLIAWALRRDLAEPLPDAGAAEVGLPAGP